jgi:hypothetical protein
MLLVISCLNNQITSLNLANTNAIQALYCSNNQLTTLDVRNLNNVQSLFTSANLLTSLLIKNGSFESNLLISGNPTLEYICADESEINFVQDEKKLISNYDLANILILPSFTEAHPKVIDEALSRMRPVIIFNDIKYVIQNRYGIFSVKRNAIQLTRVINYIKTYNDLISNKLRNNILPQRSDFLKDLHKIISSD